MGKYLLRSKANTLNLSPIPHIKEEREMDPRFAETRFVVEATAIERKYLYDNWRNLIDWRQQHSDLDLTICENRIQRGNIEVLAPLVIRFHWDLLHGSQVMFYYPTSAYFDFVLIDNWLLDNCNPLIGNLARAFCSASSFDRCVYLGLAIPLRSTHLKGSNLEEQLTTISTA